MIFEAKCIACHENGQNVLQRGKTLFPSALEANGYATEDAIATLLVNGKGQM
jgi:cytochrome c6